MYKSRREWAARAPLRTGTPPTRQAPETMGRQCGVCRYGDSRLAEDSLCVPSAACVLAFSSTTFRGRDGILAKMETMSADAHVPLAAAHCMVCRRCTWMSSADNDISVDCVDFMRHWSDAQHIQTALPVMQRALKTERGRFKRTKVSTQCSGSQSRESGSTEKTSKRGRCVSE